MWVSTVSTLILCFATSVAIAADPIVVEQVSFSTGADARVLFKDGKIQTSSRTSSVQLAFAFNHPVALNSISIESCGDTFSDGAKVYFYPGWRQTFVEGGQKILNVSVPDSSLLIQSVTFDLDRQPGVCLTHLVLKADAKTTGSVVVDSNANRSAENREIQNRVKAFEKADMSKCLDTEMESRDADEVWLFRFRSDGRFFVRGYGDDLKQARNFSAVGTYSVVQSSKTEILLELNAKKAGTSQPWDGWIPDSEKSGEKSPLVSVVQDRIVLQKWKNQDFIFRNRTKRNQRALPFSDLVMASVKILD